MPHITDYNITEDAIQSYVLRNKPDALTYPQLQAIAYDYLQKVMRKPTKYPRWPKGIKELCYSQGIRQDKDTGLPVKDDNGVTAWSERARVAETQLEMHKFMFEHLTRALNEIADLPSVSQDEGAMIARRALEIDI